MGEKGRIIAICLSEKKGVCKTPVPAGRLIANFGLEGDAHAGTPDRQVSLLSRRSVDKMRGKNLKSAKAEEDPTGASLLALDPGVFAENIAFDADSAWENWSVGTRIRFERGPVLEISQIGKECHTACAIRKTVGDCVMPREGLFARVIQGGEVRPGDEMEVL